LRLTPKLGKRGRFAKVSNFENSNAGGHYHEVEGHMLTVIVYSFILWMF